MSERKIPEDTSTKIGRQPDFRISVRNFGPIKSGSVAFRPLTVCVGPSNTGKTYFATLIYALRKVMGGFPRLPVVDPFRHPFFALDTNLSGRHAVLEEWELLDIRAKLTDHGRQFRFSDFPESVQETAQITLCNPDSLGTILGIELERCFDLESVSELVRFPVYAGMNVELTARESKQSL